VVVGRGVRGAIMAVPLLAIMKILLAATNHPMAQGTPHLRTARCGLASADSLLLYGQACWR